METKLFDIDYQISNSLYGKLFHEVQFAHIFPDSKTFPDCTPNRNMEEILHDYIEKSGLENFDLKNFVLANFDLPTVPQNNFKTNTNLDLASHITNLWPFLTIDKLEIYGSYIPLPKPFVVPGGRFQELYYWDSYFTCLGLMIDKKFEEVENIIDNFSYLIQNLGFVPNANRSYFSSRSQPPFFAPLIRLFSEEKGEIILTKYLPILLKEYAFWMEDAEKLSEHLSSSKRVVKIKGSILNRFWDNKESPRPESYREDIELVEKIREDNKHANIDSGKIYRDIRAAAESGWDFSSRWFADGQNMENIETTDILPVDLNCLLYFLEDTIAKTYSLNSNFLKSEEFKKKAENRKEVIKALFWGDYFFYDFNFTSNNLRPDKTLAACFPLFFNIASDYQAKKVAEIIEKNFLQSGGLVTTLKNSGQQWDWPNGWAPLQWIAYTGFKNYGYIDLANKIKENWLKKVQEIYLKEGKFTEKYDVVNAEKKASGGEYPNQDGFGWTNGVTLKFLHEK